MLARYFELLAFILDFAEQAHVLYRDRGLVSKRRDQFDLLVDERLYFRAGQGQSADRDALSQHRDAENCAEVSQSRRFNQSVLWISPYVGDMNHPTFN